jgi:hypothetical protein
MSNRTSLMGRIACGAALTFALAPTAAQAVVELPHNYLNQHPLVQGEAHRPVMAVGGIALKSGLGEIKCLNTFYNETWNEKKGTEPTERGYGEVVGWGTSQCTAATIPALERNEEHKAQIERGIEEREKIEHHEALTEKAGPVIRCFSKISKGEIGSAKCLTVVATAEMPLEFETREGEICKVTTRQEETEKTVSQCPRATERETDRELRSAVRRRVSSLPWKVEAIGEYVPELEEKVGRAKVGLKEWGEKGTSYRGSTTNLTKCYPKPSAPNEVPEPWTEVPAGCIKVNIIFPQLTEFVFYGTQELLGRNGFANGLNASHLSFSEAGGAGALYSQGGVAGHGETLERVMVFGAKAQELATGGCEKETEIPEQCPIK